MIALEKGPTYATKMVLQMFEMRRLCEIWAILDGLEIKLSMEQDLICLIMCKLYLLILKWEIQDMKLHKKV